MRTQSASNAYISRIHASHTSHTQHSTHPFIHSFRAIHSYWISRYTHTDRERTVEVKGFYLFYIWIACTIIYTLLYDNFVWFLLQSNAHPCFGVMPIPFHRCIHYAPVSEIRRDGKMNILLFIYSESILFINYLCTPFAGWHCSLIKFGWNRSWKCVELKSFAFFIA